MRIIDKQQDYYDYLQDYDDTLVFDRRGSFLLTKELLCKKLDTDPFYSRSKYHFMIMQCGVTYWFFLVHLITKTDAYGYKDVVDYELQLIGSWKNYDKPYCLISMKLFAFNDMWKYELREWTRFTDIIPERVVTKFDTLKSAIDNNDISYICDICRYIKCTGAGGRTADIVSEEQTIPILKACKISSHISAEDMYHAIDEYFSLSKTASEKSEAEGTTNKDKIINHGFDTKTSFRGK